jgi:DNA (cytosine-5)-methyltransferase 1
MKSKMKIMITIAPISMPRKLRVADLFCGAGGFSEGFRQCGFEIAYAIDSWSSARRAYSANHRDAIVVQRDILSFNPQEFKKVDIIIGSPPCNDFSLSNKEGHGDVERGLKLVFRFLECVEELQPKYWIMENVPRLELVFQHEGFADELRRRGITTTVPQRIELNAADFGAPQRRRRLLIGKFPLPNRTHSQYGFGLQPRIKERTMPWVPMRRVFDALPYPLGPQEVGIARDPNYPTVSLFSADVQNHYYDTTLTPVQVADSRMKKVNHPWCGRMRFPDSLDEPARTVTAVQAKTARETIVIRDMRNSTSPYRTPTPREYACLQTFPINYTFPQCGPTTATRLIGNAIPPLMAFAIARAILTLECKSAESSIVGRVK